MLDLKKLKVGEFIKWSPAGLHKLISAYGEDSLIIKYYPDRVYQINGILILPDEAMVKIKRKLVKFNADDSNGYAFSVGLERYEIIQQLQENYEYAEPPMPPTPKLFQHPLTKQFK